MQTSFDIRQLRDALGAFTTGVTVVTGFRDDGEPVGITANSFTSISLEPPLIGWGLARASPSRSAFRFDAQFAVTILNEDQQDVALRFASRAQRKFPEQAPIADSPPPWVPGGICRLECRVTERFEVGDHLLIIGLVSALAPAHGAPLIFHRGRFGRLEADPNSPVVDIWATFGGAWH